MDVPHLFSVSTHLPPQSLSVFIPLCDLVPSNGPTEYQLGTHMKANLVKAQRACARNVSGRFVCDVRSAHHASRWAQ